MSKTIAEPGLVLSNLWISAIVRTTEYINLISIGGKQDNNVVYETNNYAAMLTFRNVQRILCISEAIL